MTRQQKLDLISRYCRNRWALQRLEGNPKALFRSTRMTALRAKIECDELNYPRCRFIYAAALSVELQ